MSKSMLVNVTAEEEHRVAIVDDGILDVFEIETFSREHLKGDFFKATVEGVNPALEAAFVNYGGERAAFLPLDEVNFKLYPSRNGGSGGKGRGSRITRHLEKGMEILVQVIRDSFANKPPTMSTYYSLPGRYLVLMPGADAGGISRKIDSEEHRDRLRRIIDELTVPEGFGVIVRTAGMETESKDLQADLDGLLELWRSIEHAGSESKAPALLFQERDLVIRTLRDYYTSDIEEVLIDDEPTFLRARTFFEAYMADRADLVRLYKGDKPIFSKYNLEDQIETIYRRVVQLKSGGSISIDQTEALSAIDVNSARSVRSSSSEDTAVRTNLEAAQEIARQLRLRDIGGLIVIDFIDMESPRRSRQVERAFAAAMAPDKARYDMTRISKLGLMEVSRQRIKATKASSSFMECPTCSGDGTIRTAEAAARLAFRKIQARVARGGIAGVHVYLPPDVTTYILNQKRDDLHHLESRHGLRIEVSPEVRLKPHQFEIEEVAREQEEETVPVVTAETVDQAIASGSVTSEPRTEAPADSATRPSSGKKRRRRRRKRTPRQDMDAAQDAQAGAPASEEESTPDSLPDRPPTATAIWDAEEPEFSEGPVGDSAGGMEARAEDAGASDVNGNREAAPVSAGDKPRPKRRRRRRRRGGRGSREGRQPGAADATRHARPHRRSSSAPSAPTPVLVAEDGRRLDRGGAARETPARPAEPAASSSMHEAPPPEAAQGEQKPKRRWWHRAFKR
jgi:ribonuclease E